MVEKESSRLAITNKKISISHIKLEWKSMSEQDIRLCAVEHEHQQLVAFAVDRDDRRSTCS